METRKRKPRARPTVHLQRLGNSKQPRLERDDAIRNIRKYGRKGWKRRIGYHRRSLVETAMFRIQCFCEGAIFGDRLKNRLFENHSVVWPEYRHAETRIRCKILNHFTNLGLPEYFSK